MAFAHCTFQLLTLSAPPQFQFHILSEYSPGPVIHYMTALKKLLILNPLCPFDSYMIDPYGGLLIFKAQHRPLKLGAENSLWMVTIIPPYL